MRFGPDSLRLNPSSATPVHSSPLTRTASYAFMPLRRNDVGRPLWQGSQTLPDPLSGFFTLSAVCAAPTLHGLLSCRLRPWDSCRPTSGLLHPTRPRTPHHKRARRNWPSMTRHPETSPASKRPSRSCELPSSRRRTVLRIPDSSDPTGDRRDAKPARGPKPTHSPRRPSRPDTSTTTSAAPMSTRIESFPL